AMRALTLVEANTIIEGTFASAKKRKAHALAAIVLDAGGRVKAFQKQDGASLMRFEIAYGKAFGALALNRSSRQVLQKAKEKPAFMPSLSELADGPLFLEARGRQPPPDAGGGVGGPAGPPGARHGGRPPAPLPRPPPRRLPPRPRFRRGGGGAPKQQTRPAAARSAQTGARKPISLRAAACPP